MAWFRKLLGGGREPGLSVDEVARRLDCTTGDLTETRVEYHEFSISKRSGGRRIVLAPAQPLKLLQRRIHRRLLRRLGAHPAATGFERGHSIVSNARFHEGSAVVIRMDIRDFFARTTAVRVRQFLLDIGWSGEAADVLVHLCTHRKALPAGAPTSPRLANLVNFRLDARLEGLANAFGARYSRYADDITISLSEDDGDAVSKIVRASRSIADDFGYVLHSRSKFSVRRRHQRQQVTGLVVNDRARLPREMRRWLRAVEHHVEIGRPITLTPSQLEGWRAYRRMTER